MSKYPGNPWWHQSDDMPMMPSDQVAWDEAEERGFITPEHVLARLELMLRVAIGESADGGASYDEDGFVVALVAAGWSGEGWRLQLHPNDHDPPHLHFFLKGEPNKQIRLSLATGEPFDGETIPTGRRKKLKRAMAFIIERQADLMRLWNEAHPQAN